MWRGDPGFLGQDFDKKRREILTMAESGRFSFLSANIGVLGLFSFLRLWMGQT